jgi:hypothetical protein
VAYVVTTPNLCLSYNKWGRPNPPYVVFRQSGNDWLRIGIEELPTEFKNINLYLDDNQWKIQEKSKGKGHLSPQDIVELNAVLPQPEFKAILREALPEARLLADCDLRVQYKGRWILPNDSIARKFIDSQEKR